MKKKFLLIIEELKQEKKQRETNSTVIKKENNMVKKKESKKITRTFATYNKKPGKVFEVISENSGLVFIKPLGAGSIVQADADDVEMYNSKTEAESAVGFKETESNNEDDEIRKIKEKLSQNTLNKHDNEGDDFLKKLEREFNQKENVESFDYEAGRDDDDDPFAEVIERSRANGSEKQTFSTGDTVELSIEISDAPDYTAMLAGIAKTNDFSEVYRQVLKAKKNDVINYAIDLLLKGNFEEAAVITVALSSRK